MNFLSTPRRISLALGVSRFLKMLLGLVVLYLSVKYFGTTFHRDSWVLSISFWGIIICFLYTPINDIFRTKFIYLREQEGEENAMKSVNSLMFFFNLSYIFVALIVFICIGPIVSFLAPGFDDGMKDFLSVMIFSLIPFFMLQQHGNILIALLNTYESYFYPEVVFLTSSVVNVLAIIFLSDVVGIYSLVLATTLNGILMVLFLTCMLKKKVRYFHPFSIVGLKAAKPFVMFSLPMYLSTFLAQLYFFVEKSLCTRFGEGAVSVFDYARQIANMPYVVFSSIVPIVMTPLLSTAFINGDEDGFSKEMRRLAHLFLYLTSFFVILMNVCSEQVSYFLFSYNQDSFVKVLGYLCGGILFMTITLICGQALIARNRVIDYVVSVIVGNLLSILLCFIFVNISVHLEYIAVSFLVGQVISSSIALYKLKIKEKHMLFRNILLLFVSFAITYGLLRSFQNLMDGTMLLSVDSKMYVVLDILVCAILVFFILLCMLLAFDAEERKTVHGLCKNFFKHK